LLKGDRGRITAEQVAKAIQPDDVHRPVSRLVSLENTANRGGGACYDFEEIKAIRQVCDVKGLGLHLDGARIFNALVYKGEKPGDYGQVFDSISVCLSKGLGTPTGSVLLGEKDFIKKARRFRKVLGGGMRQAGFLAAAGTYALQNHIERLAEDHAHAKAVANLLATKDWVNEILPVETNILIFSVQGKYTAASLAETLASQGVKTIAISPQQLRMVFHLDVTSSKLDRLIQVLDGL
jgi:threonine aldolase